MKKLMLICAPVGTRSGYGAHCRDLVWSFIDGGEYEVKILDVPWGQTPRNALDKNNKNDKKILDCLLTQPQTDRQPDVYVDIRIPNEFQTYGKVNIGITAGIETNAVSSNWIDSCNKMDLVIVPSEHSKSGFVSAVYDKLQQLPNGEQQKVGELRLEKPMEVIFEGSDEDIYKPIENTSLDLVDDIPEDFAFLTLGQWGKGNFGEDRKDIATTIKCFYESFANKKEQPCLVLKTSGASTSILDREDCLHKIRTVKNMFPKDWKLPNVYLLHGDLTDDGINKLYNHPKIKCMLSLTHGEGYGRPLQEATMVGLPVIASGWSGQMDFLSETHSLLVGGKLQEVPKSAHWKDIIIPQSQWFYVDEQQASKMMNYVFENCEEMSSKALELMKINRDKFTLKKMSEKLNNIVREYTKDIPQQVGLQLPKLKKVDKKDSPSSIQLPKLKKTNQNEGASV
tara:strand:+ start:1367 stop:2725 length:1359 start_codon:yes stop_codon:yes gene_type:complete